MPRRLPPLMKFPSPSPSLHPTSLAPPESYSLDCSPTRSLTLRALTHVGGTLRTGKQAGGARHGATAVEVAQVVRIYRHPAVRVVHLRGGVVGEAKPPRAVTHTS